VPERLSDYAERNRAAWTVSNARYTSLTARDRWARTEIAWGVFKTPESEVRILPEMRGLEVVELGCGTAYFGAWLKRQGASRVVGVDITPAQLTTAAEMNAEFGLGLEFIEANAEEVPLPDATFDLAFSEYGASIWCDPYLWIPEAARLLRAHGELIFLRHTDLLMACMPDEGQVAEALVRPIKGMHRFDWDEEEGPETNFHISLPDMFELLHRSGFEVLDYRQLYAPPDAADHPYYTLVPAEWAKKWPHEEIWRARKR